MGAHHVDLWTHVPDGLPYDFGEAFPGAGETCYLDGSGPTIEGSFRDFIKDNIAFLRPPP